jgi:hypothetical protein
MQRVLVERVSCQEQQDAGPPIQSLETTYSEMGDESESESAALRVVVHGTSDDAQGCDVLDQYD